MMYVVAGGRSEFAAVMTDQGALTFKSGARVQMRLDSKDQWQWQRQLKWQTSGSELESFLRVKLGCQWW